MQIRDLMNPSVVSITPGESTALAARLLARHNIGSIPVCSEDGHLRGIVTDRDIVLRCVAAEEDPSQTPVRDVMSKTCITVSPEDDPREATRLMSSQQVRRLPVVDDGKVVGMVSLGDLAVTHAFDMEASKALSEISENVKHH
ncbi:MAG: hypothetical protein H6Q60_858 [Oscillospiraceae bacterium]|nr:hypothetical protein [Oscillospiraceae bacterium]